MRILNREVRKGLRKVCKVYLSFADFVIKFLAIDYID